MLFNAFLCAEDVGVLEPTLTPQAGEVVPGPNYCLGRARCI